MADSRYIFPATARLRKRYEFDKVYRMGCKFNTPHFVLLMHDAAAEESRLGITVSRKVGNAAVRNRMKRLVREFFRTHRHLLAKPMDLSVIAKRNAGQLSSTVVWSELQAFLRS